MSDGVAENWRVAPWRFIENFEIDFVYGEKRTYQWIWENLQLMYVNPHTLL